LRILCPCRYLTRSPESRLCVVGARDQCSCDAYLSRGFSMSARVRQGPGVCGGDECGLRRSLFGVALGLIFDCLLLVQADGKQDVR
jgi:hypothetical protein